MSKNSNSNQLFLVGVTGLEPARLAAQFPKLVGNQLPVTPRKLNHSTILEPQMIYNYLKGYDIAVSLHPILHYILYYYYFIIEYNNITCCTENGTRTHTTAMANRF